MKEEQNETKTLKTETFEELKKHIDKTGEKAQAAVNEYRALVQAVFGTFPKNEMQLVQFIEKVMEYKK